MTAPVIVFAKAPVPGAAKTRLIPALGAAGAARLHERLVDRTLATAVAAAVGPVELCCAPDASHPFFAACAGARGASLAEQGPGDLGDRMHAAFRRVLAGAPGAIVIGCDCPALMPDHLREVAASLSGGYDAALVPAADGGYVMIGLTRVSERLFERVRWGESSVMEETRARLAELGWRWRELEPLWDVDRPEDLVRLRGILDE